MQRAVATVWRCSPPFRRSLHRAAVTAGARRLARPSTVPPAQQQQARPSRARPRLVPQANSASAAAAAPAGEPAGGAGAAAAAGPPAKAPPEAPPPMLGTDMQLTAYHYLTFFLLLAGGLVFLALLLYFTGDIEFQRAVGKVVRRLLKTVALRQVFGILSAMAFVRYGLEPLIKNVRTLVKAQGPWEKSSEYYILRELYKPLEFLFLVAAFTTLAENFLPQLLTIPKSIVQTVVRSTLSLTFVITAARVVFNIKGRVIRESAWQLELKGDLTRQRRLEAVDKLLSVLTLVVAAVFGLQALGLDVNSVLAIGGVGGLAVGLAGREILENLFTGLIILSSNPFEVGDEVMFRPASGQVVEGIVVDVGWYRTTIRSFEREIFNIPNSVFSRNVVLNITRKQREWRFYEFVGLRLEDLPRVNAVVSDIRKILRQDSRIIQKLHRRVFLDKITPDQLTVYLSFYVEAANRDAFMAIKQDLLLAFVDCVERNGARLARSRLQLEMLPSLVGPGAGFVGVPALPLPVDVTATPAGPSASAGGGGGASSGGPSSSSSSGGPSGGAAAPKPGGGGAGAGKAASNIVPAAGNATTGSAGAGSAGAGTSSGSPSAGSGTTTTVTVTTSGGGGAPQQELAAAAAAATAAAVLSNPGSLGKIAAAIQPDDILAGRQDQEGLNLLASFDDLGPAAPGAPPA